MDVEWNQGAEDGEGGGRDTEGQVYKGPGQDTGVVVCVGPLSACPNLCSLRSTGLHGRVGGMRWEDVQDASADNFAWASCRNTLPMQDVAPMEKTK